jgi:hypothetical protein
MMGELIAVGVEGCEVIGSEKQRSEGEVVDDLGTRRWRVGEC